MLDEVSNEEWTYSLGQVLTSQWPLYEYLPEYKVKYALLKYYILNYYLFLGN